MYGYGYGAQGIWDDWFNAEDTYDGRDVVRVPDKTVKWQEALEFPSGDQMTLMRGFFENYNWWELIPRFDDSSYISAKSKYRNRFGENVNTVNNQFSLATIDNDLYVLYLFNNGTISVTLKGLSNTKYVAKWFNPRTGEYSKEKDVLIFTGMYNIGKKPDSEDWVFVMEKKGMVSYYLSFTMLLLAVAPVIRIMKRKKKGRNL